LIDFWKRVEARLVNLDRKRAWLAQESGVNLGAINTAVSRDSLPKADDACAIAKTLDCSVEYLVTGSDREVKSEPEDPIIVELHDYLRGLSRDDLIEVRGALKVLTHVTLVPQIRSARKEPTAPESERAATRGR
jgi:hypothetical protein